MPDISRNPLAERGASAGHGDDPHQPGRIGWAFGLSAAESGALDALLQNELKQAGLDGAGVVARLNEGLSLARALQLPEGTTQALYGRAYQWFTVGRYDRAEMLFHALSLLEPANRNHLVGFAICLKLRGASEHAEMALRRAIKSSPGWGIPYFHLLEIATRGERWDDAEVFLRGFDARTERDVPPAIVADVKRFRVALAMRRQHSFSREQAVRIAE